MNTKISLSFVNGLTAGAGITLSLMSVSLLYMVVPLEGKGGFTTMDIRIAVFLGVVVFAVSICYQVFRKKDVGSTFDKNKYKANKNKSNANE